MSLLKYAENKQIRKGNGRGPLHFGRASVDGLPYRGPNVPLKDNEYYELTETVYDAKVDIFDISKPEQKQQLTFILDAAANQWFRVLHMDRRWVDREDGSVSMVVYVEWVEPHRELNKQQASALAGSPVGSSNQTH